MLRAMPLSRPALPPLRGSTGCAVFGQAGIAIAGCRSCKGCGVIERVVISPYGYGYTLDRRVCYPCRGSGVAPMSEGPLRL